MPSPPFKRRQVLQVGAAMGTPCIVGCFQSFRSGTVSVNLANEDDQQHSLDLELRSDGKIVFNNQYVLTEGERLEDPDVVEAGEYRVRASLVSGDEAGLLFHMNGCTSNVVNVIIDNQGGINLEIGGACD